MAAALEEACWEYLDPKGFTRGPFAGKTMVAWYDNGMLPEDLRVRHNTSMGFMAIMELFPKPTPPFRTKPGPKKVEPPKPAPAPVPAVQVGQCNCSWMYQDSKGNIQGPFQSAQMLLWHEHKMLPKDLSLRRSTDVSFATISEFFPKPLEPFKSNPVTPLAHRLMQAQRQVGPQDASHAATNGNFAKAAPASAPQPSAAQQQAAAAQSQPKAKAKAKDAKGKGSKPTGQEAEADDGSGGKAGKGGKDGKGAVPIGAAAPKTKAKAKAAQENWWEDPQWSGDGKNKNWWDSEWSSWNGWSGEAGQAWDAQEGYARGGKQGAEWKAGDGTGNSAAAPGGKEKGEKGEKTTAAQQHANGFGLKWGPKSEVTDLFPEKDQKRVLDEGIVWEERWVSPLAVRFSQGKIHPFFHERGPISEVLLQIHSTADEEGNIRYIDPPFPPMRLLHLKPFGVLVTLDNRRLYALQRFALQEWPQVCLVKALCVEELTPTRLKAENRKFTNRTCGLEIEIESRSNAFDTFSWVTEAARLEHPRFCRPIAFKAVDKALSLLPVLVVHMLLDPKIRPILQSRWPMLQFLAGILKVSQRRELPARRLMLNHVIEMARPNRETSCCPQVCVGFEIETLVRLSKGKSCLTSNHIFKRPVTLLETPLLMSPMQQKALRAFLPFFCLPYARSVLKGETQAWVVGFLLAWGKVAIFNLREVPAVESVAPQSPK